MNNFKKTTLNSRNTRITKKNNTKKLPRKGITKVLIYIVLFLLALGFLASLIIYVKFIKDLPSIEELENLNISESSVIYDRDGNVLYRIYEEKRTYVEFEKIGTNAVNALVAGEDKRFWSNPGFDVFGLARAFIYGILGKNEGFGGTSSITQQLIRNTIIENRSSDETFLHKIERKIKELYLAFKLTNGISKEKILELYFNKIPYGNNAYGIEQASKTYFNKSAIDLNILEASILASIPKGPSYYSPYTHPDRLLGYIFSYDEDDETNKIEVITQKDVEANVQNVDFFKDYITNLKGSGIGKSDKMIICGVKEEDFFRGDYEVDNEGCMVLKYSDLFDFLNNIKLKNGNSLIEYQTGRKDYILGRMLEDGYINFEDYKKAIIDSIAYVFNQEKENIKAPHFVFFVKEYLEEKYGDILSVGGLQIYTTLDSKLQDKAEELIKKQVDSNTTKFNATNAALISLDNKNGDILAMVGGVDYFDQENKGNVNIITSKLQPGSSFKPFVYSIGMYSKEIGSKTPIYDLQTTFPGNYTPKNFEGGFEGKMNVSTALNHSRNIPAIKMFYMAGGEANVVNFMKKLGVTSLNDKGLYGAPLALGTGEMTPLELATAYSVFANLGEKVEVNPILKIIDNKGNVVEEKLEPKKERVIGQEQTYIINSILSDTTTRNPSRNSYISLGGTRPVAAKTGTSTKQFERNGRKDIYPANLWTIGYTPQITTIVWAGNTDGSQVGMSGDGLNGAGPIWRDFMYYAHEGKAVENWRKPASVYEINISEVSGLLPNPENSNNLLEKSLFINKPTTYDQSYQVVQIDTLCGGKVTPDTPPAAIKEVTLVEFHSLNPSNPNWEEPVQEWAKSEEAREKYGNISNMVTSVSDEICKRSGVASSITIGSNLTENGIYFVGENHLEIGYKSGNPIKSIEIIVNGSVVQSIDTAGKKEGVYLGSLFIGGMNKSKNISVEIRAIDEEYYSSSEVKNIFISDTTDNIAPTITMINPTDDSIKLYEGDYFNLRFSVNDTAKIKTTIFIDDVEFKKFDSRRIDLAINEAKDLTIGHHKITIKSEDTSSNSSDKVINLEVMKK